MIPVYQKNLVLKFSSSFLKISFFFLSLIIVLNLFEEISFFKNTNSSLFLPLYVTILNAPSVLFDVFPFIFLISTMYFFMEILDKDELIIYKTYGLTNLKIIKTISLSTIVISFFLVFVFYNISSSLKFLYLDIKNDYAKDSKYLAVVTANGLWIKDEINDKTNFINAEKIEKEYLLNVAISQFDKNFVIENFIVASKVNIKENLWVIENAFITKNNTTKNINNLKFESNFDLEKILSLFSNLSSLNYWELNKLRSDYKSLGYGTEVLSGYQHKLISYPLYLSIMVCISSILMLNIKYNKSKVFNLVLGILISVIIYYINYFFSVIIETKRIPYIYSIWGPQFILALIVLVGLLRINEK
jgi:lipopolysaccharide export system permease protein